MGDIQWRTVLDIETKKVNATVKGSVIQVLRGFRHEFLAEVRTGEAFGVEGAGRVDDG